ncbi:MAG TPA: DUF2232 domain-containing protein [bacterium]|nr:DUF2232 domain-containing protein [bacterium]HQH79936.1 DUF2232 domain-containing protein [bacterium]
MIGTRIVLVAALAAAVLYLSGFLAVLTPLPILYVFSRLGRRAALKAGAIAILAAGSLYSLAVMKYGLDAASMVLPLPIIAFAKFLPPNCLIALGIFYLLSFIMIGGSIGDGFKKRVGIFKTGLSAMIAGSLPMVVAAAYCYAKAPAGMLLEVRAYFEQAVVSIAEINRSAGISGAPIDLLLDKSSEIASFALSIVPSIFFIYGLAVVAINMILGRRILIRRGMRGFGDFAKFRLPDALVWAVIANGTLFFANKYTTDSIMAGTVAVNGIISLLAMYFLQGIAVIAFVLRGIKKPALRMIVYIFIIFFFRTVSIAIVCVGLADVWINFRLKRLRGSADSA